MMEKNFVIKNRLGLQVRTAGTLAGKIQNYRCKIYMLYNDSEYNAKSILGLMSAGVKYDHEVVFIFDGDDESEAVEMVASILGDGEGGLACLA